MFGSHRKGRGSACLLVLLALSLGCAAAWAGVARADTTTPAPSPSASPTVVREDVAKRTEYSSTYLLSNGSYRAVLSEVPVHFKDASGAWQSINPALVPAGNFGSYETAAAPVSVSVQNATATQAPVTLTSGSHEVSLSLLGASEENGLALGESDTFAGVAPATNETYTATGDGLEETLSLLSAAAPTTFTYRIAHPGLSMAQEPDGDWGLYAPGATTPSFELGCLTVSDASRDAASMPAFCDGARQVVTPGAGASTVTITIPRAWLSDPARAWPVTVDPQLFSRAPTDTWIGAGAPNTAHGSDTTLDCGQVSGSTGDTRTLVRFPQVANIFADDHIEDAQFQIREFWAPSGAHGLVHVYRIATDATDWGNSATWNNTNLSGSAGSVELDPNGLSCSSGAWLTVDCGGTVQGWVRGDYNNRGFCVRQLSSEGSTYAREFRSAEYSDATYRPSLTVDYETPTASTGGPSSCHIGDTISVSVTAGVANTNEITGLALGINCAGHSPQSPTRGLLCWYPSSPPSGFSWGTPIAATGGGYAVASSDSYFNNSCISLVSCTHSAANQATFVFRLNSAWGDVQSNYFDSRLFLSSGDNSWMSPSWFAGTQPVTVYPQTMPASAVTATPSSNTADASPSHWFVGVGPDDRSDRGRGSVTLSWSPDPGVGSAGSGYDIYARRFSPAGLAVMAATRAPTSSLARPPRPAGRASARASTRAIR